MLFFRSNLAAAFVQPWLHGFRLFAQPLSPVLIRLGGCRTKGNSTRNRSQDSWHAMEVVHTTSVVELDDALQQRLESDTWKQFATASDFADILVNEDGAV